MEQELKCPFCGRNDFKNKRGLSNHIRCCKSNPNRVDGPNKGKKLSDEEKQKLSEAGKIAQNRPEVKQKQSEAKKGKKRSDETKQKISIANTGKKLSDETKQKLSETKKGKKLSDEHKQHIKDNHAHLSGEKHPFYGKQHTEDTKQKIGEAGKRLWEDPEVKQKIYETKKKNNSFNTSKIEKQLKEYLISHNINFETQYKSDLYPFNCDFYFPDKDLYVEIQGFWSHGDEPFNPDNPEHIEIVNTWKSKNTKFYNNCIYNWTVRDVKKRETAKINNLNWIEIFSIDLEECINIIQMHL